MVNKLQEKIIEKLNNSYNDILLDIISSMSNDDLLDIPIIEYEEPVYNFIISTFTKFNNEILGDIYITGSFMFIPVNKNHKNIFIKSEILIPK